MKQSSFIAGLINRIKGAKPDMNKKPDPNKPLYGDIKPARCPRCNGPMIEVNARTHKWACADSMCLRSWAVGEVRP